MRNKPILESLTLTTLHLVIYELAKVNRRTGTAADKVIDFFLLDCIEVYNSKCATADKIQVIDIEETETEVK